MAKLTSELLKDSRPLRLYLQCNFIKVSVQLNLKIWVPLYKVNVTPENKYSIRCNTVLKYHWRHFAWKHLHLIFTFGIFFSCRYGQMKLKVYFSHFWILTDNKRNTDLSEVHDDDRVYFTPVCACVCQFNRLFFCTKWGMLQYDAIVPW